VTRPIAEIAAALDVLTSADFDARSQRADGWERLAELCDELEQHLAAAGDVAAISGALFGILERLDGADIGTPGPVVHLLGKVPGYEEHLKRSLARRPAQLTVLMANRILNTPAADRASWGALLTAAALDERLPPGTRNDARDFLHYQQTRTE
jgi:hypothetical protein